MNKYSLEEFVSQVFKNYESTFYDISFDTDNEEHLCLNKKETVYSFDKYIRKNYNEKDYIPASPDGIYINNNNLYFVEFKNQYPKNIDPKNIQSKFKKGTEILQELISKSKFKGCQFLFCVVYKKNKSRGYQSGIEESTVKFGLYSINKNDYKTYYDNIITNDIEEFKNTFKELTC